MTVRAKPAGRGAAPFCGIDFGTSNSAVAITSRHGIGGNATTLAPLEAAHATMPSAMFFAFDAPAPVFGRQAIESYMSGDSGRLLRALKSILGHGLFHEKTLLQGRYVALSGVLTLFLKHLKAKAEAAAGHEIQSAVMGRPVQFIEDDADADDAAQADLERAARAAGFAHVEFQYEPIAAALEYERSLSGEELVLIVDIGGGTSDFSIVRVSPQRALAMDRSQDVLANRGIRVGGTDFDRMLSFSRLMPLLGLGTTYGNKSLTVPNGPYVDLSTWSRVNNVYERKSVEGIASLARSAHRRDLVDRLVRTVEGRHGHRLIGDVEHAKIELSDRELSTIDLAYVEDALTLDIDRPAFVTTIEPALDRIAASVKETLTDAGLGWDKLDSVFLTGGSAMSRAVRARIAAISAGARIVDGDMLGSVGKGLGLDALRRFQ